MPHLKTTTAILVALAAIFALPLQSAAAAEVQEFSDIGGHLHRDAIRAIAAADITRGCVDAEEGVVVPFCPDDPVTRGQMAAFLVRALDLPASEGESRFEDTNQSVFGGDIDALAEAEVTLGCDPPENLNFCPDGEVTRAEMASFLTRGLGLEAGGSEFGDVAADNPHRNDIASLAESEITRGCNGPGEEPRFCPEDPITRGEMASFLARALDLGAPEEAGLVVPVVSREGWGAVDPTFELADHEIDQITVHHFASAPGATGPGLYRGIQDYHISQGWGDIAYHFIIARDGTVYEARDWSKVGSTATEYDPTGHFLVVLEGNYDNEIVTDSALQSLAEMLAWGSEQFDVPVDLISGHRDHAATSCPGEDLERRLDDGSLQAMVEEVIGSGGVQLAYGHQGE